MARIALVSAAWRRFDVTRLALAQRAHLCGVLAGLGHDATSIIVADDMNLDIADEFGFVGVEQDNVWLGRKFNDGIEHACVVWEADYVVLIGSDDWMHPDMFAILPKPWVLPELELSDTKTFAIGRAGPQCLTGKEIVAVDLARGMLQRCRGKGPRGVIPWVIPCTALEPSHFRPIDDRKQQGIDGSLLRGLKCRPTWVWHDPHAYCRVDFKSDLNINSYRKLSAGIGYGVEQPLETLALHYPAQLVRMAQDTRDIIGGKVSA